MSQDKTILAIFDFDGTLTEGHLWLGIAKHHQEKRAKRRDLLIYIASHMPYYLAAKMKIISQEKNRAKWGEDLSTLIKGFTVEEAREAFEWVTDNYFMPLMRPEVMQIMKAHQKERHKVMLLSGMFVDFLNVISQRLGVDYVVGTKLEIDGDLYSGRIIPPLCFGENKAKFLSEYVQQSRLNIDFKQSSAYADSIYDTPVFRMVGNPVATYPDKELYQLALKQKWKIVGKE